MGRNRNCLRTECATAAASLHRRKIPATLLALKPSSTFKPLSVKRLKMTWSPTASAHRHHSTSKLCQAGQHHGRSTQTIATAAMAARPHRQTRRLTRCGCHRIVRVGVARMRGMRQVVQTLTPKVILTIIITAVAITIAPTTDRGLRRRVRQASSPSTPVQLRQPPMRTTPTLRSRQQRRRQTAS